MIENPFITSVAYRVAGLSAYLCAVMVHWGLLAYYTGLSVDGALGDSLVSVSVLAFLIFLSWPFYGWSHSGPIRFFFIGSMLLVQFAVTSGIFALARMDTSLFLHTLALRFLFSLLIWIILSQWYEMLLREAMLQNDEVEEEQAERHETADRDVAPKDVLSERISVKDGSRIHLIRLDEIYFIQACGDYVTVIASTGQYVKEQTMKYYEEHLPAPFFIRIHRSVIVNTEQIARVELYGKDNYQVSLKDGSKLKASVTGYKRLKEQLSF